MSSMNFLSFFMKKILAVLVLSIALTGCNTSVISSNPGPYDQFAQCLTDKGVKMYGADTCPHCKAQKAAFKGSFGLVTYVECTREPEACKEENITSYPTWIFEGKRKTGETSLSALSEFAGCQLTAVEQPQ